MPDESTIFYRALRNYLQQDIEKRFEEGLIPTDFQKNMAWMEDKTILEMVDEYHNLLKDAGSAQSAHVEGQLLEAFSSKKGALKIYRGLPRIYHRDNPTKHRIKQDFFHLPLLKKLVSEKFIFPLYEQLPTPQNSKITLFTWMMADGFGDFIAAKEVLSLLKTKFTSVEFSWVVLVPHTMAEKVLVGNAIEGVQTLIIRYETECPLSLFPEDVLRVLRESDLILSLPTHYPQTSELRERLSHIPSERKMPRWSAVGEYGFLESGWFHPRSKNRCMGLHFLEKGILIRKSILPDFSHLENTTLLQSLFGTETPGPAQIETFLETRKFYLAYLCTPLGGSLYLHALLKAEEIDTKPIDICTPDLKWLMDHIERQRQEGKPLLEENYGICEVQIHFEGQIHSHKIAESGKLLRILCPGAISDADFRLLVRLSGEFVGVRGNQSFSEVVSAGKAFFFDGPLHSRYFVKDLGALAENRLSMHKSTLAVFRGMCRSFLHTLPEDMEEWVDETHFQEKEPWLEIAHSIGMGLRDPDGLEGFKKFNRIVCEEHACNEFLSQLALRELIHQSSEELATVEQDLATAFAKGDLSFEKFLSKMDEAIKKFTTNPPRK